ncbi:hypothetical protein L345_18157, partial [Ophiophagus hannah]
MQSAMRTMLSGRKGSAPARAMICRFSELGRIVTTSSVEPVRTASRCLSLEEELSATSGRGCIMQQEDPLQAAPLCKDTLSSLPPSLQSPLEPRDPPLSEEKPEQIAGPGCCHAIKREEKGRGRKAGQVKVEEGREGGREGGQSEGGKEGKKERWRKAGEKEEEGKEGGREGKKGGRREGRRKVGR